MQLALWSETPICSLLFQGTGEELGIPRKEWKEKQVGCTPLSEREGQC